MNSQVELSLLATDNYMRLINTAPFDRIEEHNG